MRKAIAPFNVCSDLLPTNSRCSWVPRTFIHLELRKPRCALNGVYQNWNSEQHAQMSTLTLVASTSSPLIRSLSVCARITNGRSRKRHTCSFQMAGLRNSCPFLPATAGAVRHWGTASPWSRPGHLCLWPPMPGKPPWVSCSPDRNWSPCSLIPFGRASFLSRLWHSEIYSSMLCNFRLTRSLV